MAIAEKGLRIIPIASESEGATKPPAISIFQIWDTRYLDTSGIPSSSDRGNPEVVKEIDWDYQPNPFKNSPSRYPDGQSHSTPMSGLERRRLAETYPTMLSILAVIRNSYLKLIDGKTDTRALSSLEMQRILRGLMYLPHYLSLRGKNPIPPKHALDPAFITISNSASGTLGALEAYLEQRGYNPKDLTSPPDSEKMIEAAEKTGAMVGEKTLCVASPQQMQHFMNAVINGPETHRNTFDVTHWFDESEVFSIIKFGDQAYNANEKLKILWSIDLETESRVGRDVNKNKNPRRLKRVLPVIDEFRKESSAILYQLNANQLGINYALGRDSRIQPLTLESFASKGFKMPGILKKLSAHQPTTP